jgi:hypothetical protein
MASPIGELAIAAVQKYGKALLKFITANEVDYRQSHQIGYYIPKHLWKHFTPQAPEKGVNYTHPVKVNWQAHLETNSNVKWYGVGTRSEYRITGFGKGFPYSNNPDLVGDLLVLIPKSLNEFVAFILFEDDDIEEIQTALGIEITDGYVFHEQGVVPLLTEDACLDQKFRAFVEQLEKLPPGSTFSSVTLSALRDCVRNFDKLTFDQKLLQGMKEEYRLYSIAERKIYSPQVMKIFKSIDDFIAVALSILNSRKSRAGRSLENHVEEVLKNAHVPYDRGATVGGTTPDFIIPSAARYPSIKSDPKDIMIVGVKTTCKDRWRQVLQEAPNVEKKYILTLQDGISSKQVNQMVSENVQLVVPKQLHSSFSKDVHSHLWDIETFVNRAKAIA